MTKATYTKPRHLATYVKSPTQSWFVLRGEVAPHQVQRPICNVRGNGGSRLLPAYDTFQAQLTRQP